MDRKQQVLLKLKLKVKAFGFNKKEVMGIAARIADNLTSTDDASDEDVNAEIEAAIDAVLPYLQVSQSFANRVIEENRKKNDDDETDSCGILAKFPKQIVVTATLYHGITDTVGVSLEDNAGIILIFAEHSEIKGNVFRHTVLL